MCVMTNKHECEMRVCSRVRGSDANARGRRPMVVQTRGTDNILMSEERRERNSEESGGKQAERRLT